MPEDTDLRERVVRLETLVETMAKADEQRSKQVGTLFESVRAMQTTMATNAATSLAIRKSAEQTAARDRRVVRFVGGLLTVLWVIAQAIVLFGG